MATQNDQTETADTRARRKRHSARTLISATAIGLCVADPAVEWKQSFDGPAGTDLAADYHVYQLYREPGLVKIAIDGVVRGQYAKASAPSGARWVFDAPMYLVLNLAVGGVWPARGIPLHHSRRRCWWTGSATGSKPFTRAV